MIDGRIVGMVQEERLTKRKNQTGFPKRAIERLIDRHLEGDVSRIDRVGHSSKYEALFWTALDHYSDFDVLDAVREMHEYWYPYFYERDSGNEKLIWSDEYWREKVLRGEGLNKDHNFDLSFIERMNGKEAFDYFNEVERKEVFHQHRQENAGNIGLPFDKRATIIRLRKSRAHKYHGQIGLSHTRRHPNYAAG